MESLISELKQLIEKYEADEISKYFVITNNKKDYLKVCDICKLIMEDNPDLSCRQIENKISKLLGKSVVRRVELN